VIAARRVELALASSPTAEGHPRLPHIAERSGHPFAPYSPCGDICLPPTTTLPRCSWTRSVARLVALAALLLGAALLALAWPLLTHRRRAASTTWLYRSVLRAAGVRLVRAGDASFAPPGTGTLVVANHVSWLDILALGAGQPVRMIAKREVRSWPVIGTLAARTGALFVDRTGLRALPAVVEETAAALATGALVGVFGEATTWCGAAAGPFRRAVFQAALDAGVPVRPVALRYRLLDGRASTAPAFLGSETLWASLLRVVRLPGVVCELDILPLLQPAAGTDRRALAAAAQRAVTAATGVAATAAPGPSPRLAAVAA